MAVLGRDGSLPQGDAKHDAVEGCSTASRRSTTA